MIYKPRFIFTVLLLFTICVPVLSQQYVLLGWNDLGMHCSNKDFSKMAVLPPYNNVFAQLIKKQPGQSPQIVNTGFTVEYSIPGNTYSVGKTNFWSYAQVLFGLPNPLPDNIGLTGKGLTGNMDIASNYFKVIGVPNTPFADNDLNSEKPFQTFHLIAKLTGNIVAATDNVIPVSNEIGCVQSGCHSSEQSIKNNHENVPGFRQNSPELCARCHASNALGTTGDPEAKSFSFRIHDKHKFIQPTNSINTCYKCHPGPNTQCFRDVMRSGDMTCQDCHGTMSNIANTIENGRRPWLDEPKCGSTSCHGSNYSEEPNKLYRESKGHGGLLCSSCHGSPHAIYPTTQPNDNLQSIRVQGHAGVIDDCMVCHTVPPTGPGPHGITYIGIIKLNEEIPVSYNLYQNYPNPFNPVTVIKFDISKSSFVNIKVFDAIGREVEELVKGDVTAGSYSVEWNAEKYNSGIYFYVLKTDNYSESRKMIVIK
ncbi:MAG TPA: T9SS type A sorting domain-containing protein [Ignavibacteria bacterium]|nr:T9SS type A sorting domain-containing protein [Ignavibacteria bacterium]HMQ98733.1 T9SS type A sorting domain-containing protein [Ignavibacteria bacterium]